MGISIEVNYPEDKWDVDCIEECLALSEKLDRIMVKFSIGETPMEIKYYTGIDSNSVMRTYMIKLEEKTGG